jgi:unsaturated rhamnogalacturonyl hydrolase
MAAMYVICAVAADGIPIGLTRDGRTIDATITGKGVRTVVLIGGLAGEDESSKAVQAIRTRHRLVVIPVANPARAQLQFPPAGRAYASNPESHYLWRWLAAQAPDLVLVAGPDAGLVDALTSQGRIPARRFNGVVEPVRESAAHRELNTRLGRKPIQVAKELELHYGHALEEAVYIPAMALIARARMGYLEDVRRIVEPYAAGTKDSLAKATSSHLSGHLIFGELAERTGDKRYTVLVRRAADLGMSSESMPFHNEMSDSVFMGCPILAKAGKLSGETKYFDMALKHFRFIEKLCLRPDGLYRHSPLSEAAWGRGNAFPALGLALTLVDLPANHPTAPQLRKAFSGLMEALSRHQTPDGMWREVIDYPGAYPEFSATAMIGRAMSIGIRHGWLDRGAYQKRVDAAWRAVLARTGSDGVLFDVCESTGKQKSVEEYLRRVAILDRDPRGGGMAMLFALEMAEHSKR